MITSGKTTLKKHRTYLDESRTLRLQAGHLVSKQSKHEKSNSFAIVPIMRGYKMVLMSKFNENREMYEKMATGEITFKTPKNENK